MDTIEGRADGAGARVAIAVSRFNEKVTEQLLEGARNALREAGVRDQDVTVVRVPGALELPLACRWLAATGRFDALVALGAVIRGETSHYDHVCDQAARGILDAGTHSSLPVGFGVLTCDTAEQAFARAGGKVGNKGADAAHTALEMLALKRVLADLGTDSAT